MKYVPAIILCLPGALVVGFLGLMGAGWEGVGANPPSQFGMCCWFFWGGFGGASLGATPGLLLGCYQGMKWVCPFLGAAVGALLGVFLSFAGIINNGPLFAALVVLGFIFGSWPFMIGSRSAPK